MSENHEAHRRWIERKTSKELRIMTLNELSEAVKDTPDFWYDDIDEAYRDGFEDGFDYCIERFEIMYRKKGFVRVREIVNILWKWSDQVLRPWRYFGQGKHKNDMQHHPIHTHEKWSDIRERVISRDRGCVVCGRILRLEVDHIVEVQDGGLPEDDNLQTLCKDCHKEKPLIENLKRMRRLSHR